MVKSINYVLKEVSEKLDLDKDEIKRIEKLTGDILKRINYEIRDSNIDADAFLGGSLAKGTMVKKGPYDIDIFIRFGKEHALQNLSDITQGILRKFREFRIRRIHGSRDYFRIKYSNNIFFEVIPVKKIKKPQESDNITDLSYSHVSYIKKHVKNSKLSSEIRLAKAFCHANNCYGAESYIRGFSGYGLELLICHYKKFIKFLRAMAKIKIDKDEKLIIDMEKHHKGKSRILMDLNESKLQSPIILIDPTHKTRNVLAALSEETFKEFQKSCKNFLKNPNRKFFEKEDFDFEKIRKEAKKKKLEFLLLEAKTEKQEGDIAGSKLRKFYRHLEKEMEKFFEIKKCGFEYNRKKAAKYFFVVKRKDEILIEGPMKSQKEHVKRFKEQHKSTFIRKGKLHSKKKIDFNIEEFVRRWKFKNIRRLKEMSITDLRLI